MTESLALTLPSKTIHLSRARFAGWYVTVIIRPLLGEAEHVETRWFLTHLHAETYVRVLRMAQTLTAITTRAAEESTLDRHL